MRATALNHVSIPAVDVEESRRFYQELFAMEELPAPNFGMAVRWLRLGDLQLHLFQVPELRPHGYQHFGIEVDDFEECYRRIVERDAFEHGHALPLPVGAARRSRPAVLPRSRPGTSSRSTGPTSRRSTGRSSATT